MKINQRAKFSIFFVENSKSSNYCSLKTIFKS